MAKMANSTVGYIALLRQMASFARLGRRSLDQLTRKAGQAGLEGRHLAIRAQACRVEAGHAELVGRALGESGGEE